MALDLLGLVCVCPWLALVWFWVGFDVVWVGLALLWAGFGLVVGWLWFCLGCFGSTLVLCWFGDQATYRFNPKRTQPKQCEHVRIVLGRVGFGFASGWLWFGLGWLWFGLGWLWFCVGLATKQHVRPTQSKPNPNNLNMFVFFWVGLVLGLLWVCSGLGLLWVGFNLVWVGLSFVLV